MIKKLFQKCKPIKHKYEACNIGGGTAADLGAVPNVGAKKKTKKDGIKKVKH